jgi:hypothetical protein
MSLSPSSPSPPPSPPCQADEDVVEWLQRVTANKQKRKGISRKEKESAWRALEQRDTIQAKMMA